ncbi:hypothetical protein GCM10012275_60700 [Longimycelium tulufanense]|uniref:TraD/TraG TraM recognition site domain-containing protein n=1 Tax=Longimycelium tulufanense TaxID=907463 RepID=A0A8J3CKF0_9PSEU|nr:TraM recognition domain-containing protein [Longimycelium tulufanense]GGM81961.1 hypothetical protein GCM10012275_60700 [Longimycelium tulufanense]
MRRDPQRPSWLETWGLAVVAGLLLVLVFLVWGAGSLGDLVAGHPVETNPFAYVLGLVAGSRAWSGWPATLVLVLVAGLAGGLALLLWRRLRRRGGPTQRRIDRAARLLAHPRELGPLSPAGVAASAARLRPRSTIDPHDPAQHGRLRGRTVVGNMPVRSSWEDTEAHIWGPRRGKTTSQVIPDIVDAPGPVLTTSNKRDVVDATRGVRERAGTTWVFDPQQVAGESPTWWYNPLSRVIDIESAQILAGHFVAGTRDPNARTDSYFDGSAESLLAAYFLAAALGRFTLADVYEWLVNARDITPRETLADHGERLVAGDVQSVQEAPDKQRSGVYDTAKALLRCLRSRQVLEWVTPPGRPRPEFRPDDFVTSTDTLYLLSMEGPGAAAPLVSALADHVCTAAVTHAATMPLGRLDPPMVVQLDEAANICRWRELPNLYSHFGSRGVVVSTILQSWSQGVEVWGEGGMRKLWSAANVRTYGGGVAETAFLRELSELAGDHDRQVYSTTYDSGGRRSRSANSRTERILTVDLLAAMPAGRALVIASGAPACLVRTIPWMDGPHAEAIRTSLATYDPGARAQQQAPILAKPSS